MRVSDPQILPSQHALAQLSTLFASCGPIPPLSCTTLRVLKTRRIVAGTESQESVHNLLECSIIDDSPSISYNPSRRSATRWPGG